ncbi:hypothetical protein JTB14_002091 [Gonioctena quinquepunctata]|nr:hypothetical protein JTB14_002091 [Gonioctena quinquepunctata]
MKLDGNQAENWKMWRSRFENYLRASEVNKKSESTQCAQLCTHSLRRPRQIERSSGEIKKNLPKENPSYKRYIFFMIRQQSGQSLKKFIVDLREQAKSASSIRYKNVS